MFVLLYKRKNLSEMNVVTYVYICASVVLSTVTALLSGVNAALAWKIPLFAVGYFVTLILLHAIILGISILAVDLKKNNARISRYYRVLTLATLDLLFGTLGIRIHTTGLEKVPTDKKFLLVSNHTYDFDPAIFMHVMPKIDIGFVGKKEIYTDMLAIAKVMHKLNGLPLDRENNRNAVKTISKASEYIKSDLCSMGIFPEGYCSLTGELLPFRNGAFKIAKKAHCPIVVATISNTRIILKNIFRRPTDIYLDILEVIDTDEVDSLSTAELSDKIYPIVKENMR